jgi:hypothetical protein
MDGQVSSLSCDGMFLRSEFLDAEGAHVALHLDLPGTGGAVQLHGQVVRVEAEPRTSGMGIRFYGVALPARLQLANYMLLQSSRTMN